MITLFADASFCAKTKAAGWGAWAIRDSWNSGRTAGGPIKQRLRDSGVAELFAMRNAVEWLKNSGGLWGDSVIMLQSDNLGTLQKIKHHLPNTLVNPHRESAPFPEGVPPIFQPETDAIMELREFLSGFQSIQLRHVRGHKAGGGRNWVNSRCDSIAKSHMRKLRTARWNGGKGFANL